MSAETEEDARRIYRTIEGFLFYRGITNAELRATPLPVAATSATYTLKLDDVGGGVSYVGEADPGASTASSVWRIKRITDVSNDVAIEWADGDAGFNKAWDDRLSLSYS